MFLSVITNICVACILAFFLQASVVTPYLCSKVIKKPSRNNRGELRVDIECWIMQNLYCRKLQYPRMTAEQTITPDNLCDLYLGLLVGVMDFLYDKFHNLICPPVTRA